MTWLRSSNMVYLLEWSKLIAFCKRLKNVVKAAGSWYFKQSPVKGDGKIVEVGRSFNLYYELMFVI